jgi:dihydroorotase
VIEPTYDLILRGGRVVDPSQHLDRSLDIGISKGVIVAIEPNLVPSSARRTVEVHGKLVTPGLIDVHAHCTGRLNTAAGLDADVAGVLAGVTTVVDAGSTGWANFGGWREYVAATARSRVVCLLNIAQAGLIVTPEIRDEWDIDVESTIRVATENRAAIHGIKLRAIGPGARKLGMQLVHDAVRAARSFQGVLMVHIGDWETPDTPPLTASLLPLLEPGDMVTHVFTPHPGGILDTHGRVLPQAREALERGVFFDIAHGMNNLSFDIARRVLDQGITPSTISTDLSWQSRNNGPVYSLTETMSKGLALGLSFDQVLQSVTTNPARFLGREGQIGSIALGKQADISIVDVVTGRWTFTDSIGNRITGERAIVPLLTLAAGEPIAIDWGPHPWGWLPDSRI